MNRVIWKFPIPLGELVTISLPAATQVRLTGLDPATGEVTIWVELDPDAARVDRRFLVYGTGHPIKGDGGYPWDIHVGSVIADPFVWHVYEKRSA